MNRRQFIKSSLITLSSLTLGGLTACSPKGIIEVNKEGHLQPLPHIVPTGHIRPPGAVEERLFRAKCTGCGVCINVCHIMKYDAIAATGLREGLLGLGLPYIKDMRDYPCALCMECPKHCPTGALMNVEKEKVSMGMALIDFGLCFGYNGDVCLSCSKACPLGAKVFDFYNGEWGNQPFINEACVGCGLCVKYCPLGGSAIKVVTKRQYQTIKEAYQGEFKRLMGLTNKDRYNLVYGTYLPNIMSRGRIVEREYR